MMEGIGKEAFRSLVKDARSKRNITKAALESYQANESFEGYAADAMLDNTSRSERFPLGGVDTEYSIQEQVRPAFGKLAVNTSAIGAHPDFRHLAGTSITDRHHVCSLFLDIKNSTRLSFLYELDDVYWIKNLILRVASETVRAMDGHVHRFMGDALLAFFGSKSVQRDDSVVNAINCTSVLQATMERTIIPVLGEEGFDARDIGFRVGLDYGSDQQVLWSSYGFSSVFEVTATSFYVDVAAKLQSMAKKNAVMMGSNIIGVMDFPDAFVQKKRILENGEWKEIDTLNKTYSDRDGVQHKYRVRELKADIYRDLLPFPAEFKGKFPGSKVVSYDGIEFKCYTKGDNASHHYPSVSRVLQKEQGLDFRVTIDKRVFGSAAFPLKVVFTKRNHGSEAKQDKSEGEFPVLSEEIIVEQKPWYQAFFAGRTVSASEGTRYRGLHTMEVKVLDASQETIFRDFIGIYIQ
ncbi:adenylate/guanylate cyclase domain-containing protein [Pseudomonas sp. NEEL19]|uniref:nucleotide-binding domain-containing protein n=1 Tax=Pseudomonas sp. NEEL19 TaxID=2867409 RepID=UPI0023674DF1|nr:hypothetical protein [Pseudomonas sp. NEEL19]WDM59362.1 adenylate/guanylate cyclase domain-containing protein [Pseudomonas sp. NEEL19]